MTATERGLLASDAPALVYLGTDDTMYRIDVGAGLAGLPDRERVIAAALIAYASNNHLEEA